MGYYMDQVSCDNLLIKKENLPKALQAIKDLAGGETIKDASGRHYSWVGGEYIDAETITDALQDWRWNPEFDEEGNLNGLYFEGQKLGDDEILLAALAPYVEHGQIEMSGEGGERWLWLFADGRLKELQGRVVYE